ncbi:histone H3-like centromeric protein a [Anaeramoeba flamelloides]|uniref:Histone H3-like centromeric protein a n=1 Tax=Anaeramoeba flamelloides TaxID=1746091 RepID=A0AAV8A7R4_9EUKA|nr:histone H3-like centromeric protein a [Anaeramoeba flamelloides]
MTRDKQKKTRISSSESATETSTMSSTPSSPKTKSKNLSEKGLRSTREKRSGKRKKKSKKEHKAHKRKELKGRKGLKGLKGTKGRKGLKGLKGLKGRKGLKGQKSPYGKKTPMLSQYVQKRPSGNRYKPGKRALKEIQLLQNTHHMLMRKLPFARVVRSIARDCSRERLSELRWQKNAILCLQEATENFIIDFLNDMNLCAIHAKRVTIMDRDVHLLKRLKNLDSFQ